MIDNKTSHYKYPLPNIDNNLQDDVKRIEQSFAIIDAQQKELETHKANLQWTDLDLTAPHFRDDTFYPVLFRQSIELGSGIFEIKQSNVHQWNTKYGLDKDGSARYYGSLHAKFSILGQCWGNLSSHLALLSLNQGKDSKNDLLADFKSEQIAGINVFWLRGQHSYKVRHSLMAMKVDTGLDHDSSEKVLTNHHPLEAQYIKVFPNGLKTVYDLEKYKLYQQYLSDKAIQADIEPLVYNAQYDHDYDPITTINRSRIKYGYFDLSEYLTIKNDYASKDFAHPVGSITKNVSNDPMEGWLHADGLSVKKSDYPSLYEKLNDKFGTTETTFKLPSLTQPEGLYQLHIDVASIETSPSCMTTYEFDGTCYLVWAGHASDTAYIHKKENDGTWSLVKKFSVGAVRIEGITAYQIKDKVYLAWSGHWTGKIYIAQSLDGEVFEKMTELDAGDKSPGSLTVYEQGGCTYLAWAATAEHGIHIAKTEDGTTFEQVCQLESHVTNPYSITTYEHQGQRYLAWLGQKSNNIAIASSQDHVNYTLVHTMPSQGSSPAGITYYKSKDYIYLAWLSRGTGRLYLARSLDGIHFTEVQQIQSIDSDMSSLITYQHQGDRYLAWTGFSHNKVFFAKQEAPEYAFIKY